MDFDPAFVSTMAEAAGSAKKSTARLTGEYELHVVLVQATNVESDGTHALLQSQC
jgi:hypothetical protein